jgi:anion-transporting  ArsA/GET3 family ATPase
MNSDITPRKKPHLIMFCGSGGVGKTSIAASLAYLGALSGRSMIGFTVDPARRLKDALGIRSEVNDLQLVFPLEEEKAQGSLRIAMLDTEKAADELVDRYCSSAETAQSIKASRIFRSAINGMIGSEEYIALGKVFQMVTDLDMDFLVVDTAPTKYALNFIEGPDRLLKVLDPAVLSPVISPLLKFKILGSLSPQSKVGSILNQIVQSILGIGLIQEISDLATALSSMFVGFRTRVYEMHKILRDPDAVSIIIIANPESNSLKEATQIANALSASGIQIKAIIVNQIRAPYLLNFDQIEKTAILEDAKQLSPSHIQTCSDLVQFTLDYKNRLQMESKIISDFRQSLNQQSLFVRIPFFPDEFHTLDKLKMLHPYLDELWKKLS